MAITETVFVVAVIIFSAIIHEVMHGYAADKLGDPTARYAGRLTLNPVSHIDPIGSILLPFALVLLGSPIFFGYAKPVPYNPYNLRPGRFSEAIVAGAGPASNAVIAILFELSYGWDSRPRSAAFSSSSLSSTSCSAFSTSSRSRRSMARRCLRLYCHVLGSMATYVGAPKWNGIRSWACYLSSVSSSSWAVHSAASFTASQALSRGARPKTLRPNGIDSRLAESPLGIFICLSTGSTGSPQETQDKQCLR